MIYLSSILIQEKCLAIDFARKEIVGTRYTDSVRSNLFNVFAENATAYRPDALNALQQARAHSDDSLRTGELAERFVQALANVPGGDGEQAGALGHVRIAVQAITCRFEAQAAIGICDLPTPQRPLPPRKRQAVIW